MYPFLLRISFDRSIENKYTLRKVIVNQLERYEKSKRKESSVRKILSRLAGIFAAACFLIHICRAAGSPLRIAAEIGERTYSTDAEKTAMLLISILIFLILLVGISIVLILAAFTEEHPVIRGAFLGGLIFLFFTYACLYGYPLLDNHVTTAWFMTGRYTAQLLKTAGSLFAGVFGAQLHWNDTSAWYTVCACMLVYPVVLFYIILGARNFLPVLAASLLPALAWFTCHLGQLSGWMQIGMGFLTAAASAVFLVVFSEDKHLGSERREKKRKELVSFVVDDKKRMILTGLCAVLWIATIAVGRIRSFTAVMRLIFSSDVYKYQNNLYELADTSIVRALLLSYVLSLIMKQVFALVKVEDESPLASWLSTAYSLLLQIWIMPILSTGFSHAVSGAREAVAESGAASAAHDVYGSFSEAWIAGVNEGNGKILFFLIIAGTLLLFGLILFAVKLPFVRAAVWFPVWFSVCTYIYCLTGLYYRSPVGTPELIFGCFVLTKLLNSMLNAGYKLKNKVAAKAERTFSE